MHLLPHAFLSSLMPFLMGVPLPPPLLTSFTTSPPTTASSHLPFTSSLLPLPLPLPLSGVRRRTT